jgi:hypothetical protein
MAVLMTIGALSAILAPEPESDLVVRRDHPSGYTAQVHPSRSV